MFSQFEIVTYVHKGAFVRFKISIVWNVGNLKAFASPLLNHKEIEIIPVRTYENSWRFADQA